ncbi:rhodanese-like domain-containing protein [Pseudodesulfovibrio sp.]|uniref:rhodanese-like domain-containing protein n=1 Tax=unclassified Pseudodesulfovibrio TaxID=2661612 RepID=UPI003B0012B8
MNKSQAIIAITLLALCLFPIHTRASDEEIWIQSAQRDADRDGYKLITAQALAKLIDEKQPALILDARADYEYAAGHIPTAVNFEFDLGDRTGLTPEKRHALQHLLGPDKKRLVIVYCRSFRCLRGAIAARAAAHLGYVNVYRYPGGFHGWKALYPDRVEGKHDKPHALATGDTFPACRVAVLNGDEDRRYLGLPQGARWLELAQLNTRFVLIQLYNTLCNDCVAETKKLSSFFHVIENDPVLAGQLKIIGLGIYDSNQNVVKFKEHYDVAYPLFSDKSGQIFECLGQSQLPLAYLLRAKGDGTWIIELIKRGFFEPDENFLHTLRQAVIRAEGTD